MLTQCRTRRRSVRTWILPILLATFILLGCRGNGLDAATRHMVAAREAIEQGDTAKAIAEYTSALEIRDDFWARFERARLYAETGDDAAAKADCEQALVLSPDHADVKWLLAELEKPAAQRVQSAPPSHSK